MINPFDYFYYKIYTAWYWLCGGGHPILFQHKFVVWAVYGMNILTISTLIAIAGKSLSDVFIESSLFFLLVIILVFYRPKREKKIVEKYSRESRKSFGIGNAIVVFYVIITIISFIWVTKHYRGV